jgi:DNA-binding HxlR family transcriptional regulator
MADSDEYEPAETLVEFLQLKGSVGLIALLYERPRTYSELESEIEITSSTISRRRNDADYLNLLTIELESDEHGTKHVYTLTDLGNYVAERMAHKGIISSYYQMRDRQKEIEEKTEEVAEWVEDNPTNFIKFDAAREERITPREEAPEEPPELEEIKAAKEESEGGEFEAGNDEEEADESDESSERPRPPGESLPDDLHESDENKVQGTFDDMADRVEEPSREDGDGEDA